MKTISTLIVSLFLLTNVHAQVTYPNSTNTVWYPGDVVTITWNPASVSGPNAFIYLSGALNGMIGSTWPLSDPVIYAGYAVPNSGSYTWTVPTDPTVNTLCHIEIQGSAPYERIVSPDFQVRFGRVRTPNPVLKIKPSMYLSWQCTYGHTYDVQTSSDMTSWTSLGTVTADEEDVAVVVFVTSNSQFYRLEDLTP